MSEEGICTQRAARSAFVGFSMEEADAEPLLNWGFEQSVLVTRVVTVAE